MSDRDERLAWVAPTVIVPLVALPIIVTSLRTSVWSFEFFLFTALVFAGDIVELRLPIGSCSASSAPQFAAILLFGGPFVVVSVVVASIAEALFHRKDSRRTIYNIAQLTIAVAAGWSVFRVLGGEKADLMSAPGMLAGLAAWAVYFVTNLALVALAARFGLRASWPALWRDLIKPTLPVAPVAGVVGIVLAAAYRSGGAVTLLLFLGLYFIAQVALVSSWLKVRNEDLSTRYADARANLRDLVKGLPNGVVAVDAEGRVTLINRAAVTLLGCRSEDVLRRKANECAALRTTGVERLLGEVLTSGTGLPPRELSLASGEAEAVALCSVSVLRDAAGRPSGAVAVLQDVTEQKELERQLGHVDRLALMGEFAAGVVHEINNPLALISMALDGAKGELEAGNGEEARQDLELARRNLQRLVKLSRQLLSFSRPVPEEVRRIDLGETLDEALKIITPQARYSGVQVFADIPRDLRLLADASALHQIFLNLGANALQAMPEGGRLQVAAGRVTARCEEVVAGKALAPLPPPGRRTVRVLGPFPETGEPRGFIWVQFSDTGVGIPDEALQRLGQSFFTTKKQGTGLGLAVVCKILAQYRGVLEVSSRVGTGTAFRLWFPELTVDELVEGATDPPGFLAGWTGLSPEPLAPVRAKTAQPRLRSSRSPQRDMV